MVPKVGGSSPLGHPTVSPQVRPYPPPDARVAPPLQAAARSVLGPSGRRPGRVQAVGELLQGVGEQVPSQIIDAAVRVIATASPWDITVESGKCLLKFRKPTTLPGCEKFSKS